MSNIIDYICPNCKNEYFLTVPEEAEEAAITGAIPVPDNKKGSQILYQNHQYHTVEIVLDHNRNISSINRIKSVQTVFNTLVYSIYKACNVINTLLSSKSIDERPVVMFISDIESYKQFFASLIKIYLQTDDIVTTEFASNMMINKFSHLDFVIINPKSMTQLLMKYSKDTSTIQVLKSLVFDIGSIQQREVMSVLKKRRIQLQKDLRVTVAFDTRTNPEPPIDLREFLLNRYSLTHLDLLNYQDTNGLRSIILQSIFNLLDDPLEGRDVFEILEFDN